MAASLFRRVRRKPPIAEWLEKNDLLNLQPTLELRLNGRTLEQKWVGSVMAYHHRWVPIRRKRRDEL